MSRQEAPVCPHELELAEARERMAGLEEQVANLTLALHNARTIGQAMGILMATRKVTAEQAFDLLRLVSQRTQRKLNAVADEVTFSGVLREPPDQPA